MISSGTAKHLPCSAANHFGTVNLTTVRMQGDHSDCVRPHIFHQIFPPLSQFTTTKHHSCTQYLQASSLYGLLLLATT